MCGLFGVARLDGQALASAEAPLERMRTALLHRGPNGSWYDTRHAAALGLTRLAIRGLDDGRQPLVDEATGVMVVCNGEIDNHKALRRDLAAEGIEVSQQTDIAVILPLYLRFGADFVARLSGAFAIAIWDPRQPALLLYRDRTGERPLFYGRDKQEQIWFASELGALQSALNLGMPGDARALADYLRCGYFAAPATPYQGICKLAPGEQIQLDAHGDQKKLYWQWQHRHTGQHTPPAIDAFDAIFRNAVRSQSEVDVDFGLFLSGGLDSSLIAAVLRDVYPDKLLNAYTIRFGDASFDEGAYALTVAEQLGVPCHEVWITPEHFPQLLPEIVHSCREPLADPAWVPSAALARRAAQDIRVALVGEGADEVFAGYPTYFGAALASRYDHLPAGLRGMLRHLVERWPVSDRKVSLSFLLKRFVQGEGMTPLARHRLWTASIAPGVLEQLGLAPEAAAFRHDSLYLPEDSADPLDLLQSFDLRYLLGESLLTKADRASMHSGLELRAPFLDQDVLEFARDLSPRQRIKGITTKVFLKEYALKYLPSSIVHRKKRGLSVPLGSWLRDELYDWAHGLLSEEGLQALGLHRTSMLALLEKHRRREEDHARAVWTLMVLATWMRSHGRPD